MFWSVHAFLILTDFIRGYPCISLFQFCYWIIGLVPARISFSPDAEVAPPQFLSPKHSRTSLPFPSSEGFCVMEIS
jgi:hypothetical protein